jgi:hypothetical protein
MEATRLAGHVWNAIMEAVRSEQMPREITFGKVTKHDVGNKVVWVEEFGDTAIPLAAFAYGFSYYDTDETGAVNKRYDQSGADTHVVVPRVGQVVVIANPWGNGRFPVCLGVIQSTPGSYWQGEKT